MEMEQLLSPLTWAVLSFFLGLIVGHWLQLGRDRRKEREDALRPIRTWIVNQVESPLYPVDRPSNVEFDAYASRIGERARKRLGAASRELTASWKLTQDGGTGAAHWDVDTRRFKAAMSELLKLTVPR